MSGLIDPFLELTMAWDLSYALNTFGLLNETK